MCVTGYCDVCFDGSSCWLVSCRKYWTSFKGWLSVTALYAVFCTQYIYGFSCDCLTVEIELPSIVVVVFLAHRKAKGTWRDRGATWAAF